MGSSFTSTLMHIIPCHQSHRNEWNHLSMKGMPPHLIHPPEKGAPFAYIHVNGWLPPHLAHPPEKDAPFMPPL